MKQLLTSLRDCVPAAVRSCDYSRFALCALVLLMAGTASTWAAKWEPIDPADLAATESKSNPGADAEILFYRDVCEESTTRNQFTGTTFERTIMDTYVRAKIYTQKGVEDQGRLSIPHDEDHSLSGITARVVKPDGTVVELQKSDIFDVTIVKFGGLRYKRTQFAFPNLAPGDVVEYRWSTSSEGYAFGRWYFAQQLLPIRDYSMRFEGSAGGNMIISWFNCPGMQQKKRGNSLELTMQNVPAFEEEDLMPPERQFRGWIFQIKTFGITNDEEMWREISLLWANEFLEATAPTDAIKKQAAQLVAGAANDEEKLRRLYEYCRREITNFDRFDLVELQKEREKSKEEDVRSARTVFERKYGWRAEINRLFASLARAAGFEARLFRNPGRDVLFDVRKGRMWAFFDRSSVAVKIGDQWRYFDPGDYIAQFGMLSWRDEGVTGLLTEETAKRYTLQESPLSPPTASRAVRHAALKLSEDGTVEGDVTETLTGQVAHIQKSVSWGSSAAEIETDIREQINKRLPDAEITELKWKNLISADEPLEITYHVRVPGYVQRAGAGMVIRPSFFQVGRPALFATPTRKYPIMFPFAWQEADEVAIELPEGYELDRPSAPRPVENSAIQISSNYKITFAKKSRTLRYARNFSIGGSGMTAFRAEAYPLVKQLFDDMTESDLHALMLKPKAAVPVDTAPTAPTAAEAPAGGSSP